MVFPSFECFSPYGTLEEKAADEINKRLVVSPTIDSQRLNPDANGSLIAVSYEARAAGVRRNDRGLESVKKCKELRIVQVPVKHGKADLTMYRTASRRVMACLRSAFEEASSRFRRSDGSKDSFQVPVEIASIDEVYVDLSEPVWAMIERIRLSNDGDQLFKQVVDLAGGCTTVGGVEVLTEAAQATNALHKDDLRKGSSFQVLDSSNRIDDGSKAWWNRPIQAWTVAELSLACGSYLAAHSRKTVSDQFDGSVFTLSGGISSNKTLAKLASGLKKPNRQTLIHRHDENGSLEKLFHPLPLGRIRGLGGKFGDRIGEFLCITTVGQLSRVPMDRLIAATNGDNKMAQFLFDMARGICHDPVTERSKPKSIACEKTFRNQLSIPVNDSPTIEKWIGELCAELMERVQMDKEENKRNATKLVVHVKISTQARSCSKHTQAPKQLEQYKATALQTLYQLIRSNVPQGEDNLSSIKITCMGVSAAQFVDNTASSATIMAAFQRASKTGKKSESLMLRDSPINRRTEVSRKRSIDTIRNQPKASNRSGVITQCQPKMQTEKKSKSDKFFGRRDTKSKTSRSVALPSMDEIDPSILAELPAELRRTLLNDIRQQQRTNQKSSGIRSFFGPKGNR